jgi:hypothetical protein
MISLWSQSGASALVTLSGKRLAAQAFLKHSCLVESLTSQPLAVKNRQQLLQLLLSEARQDEKV